MRRAGLVLLALLVAGSALGQSTKVQLGTVMNTSVGAFVRDRKGWTLLDGMMTVPVKTGTLATTGGAIEASFTAVGPRLGRFAMRYGGVILMAGSLIYSALDWFYDEAKKATGTGLDGWYDSDRLLGFPNVAGLRVVNTDSYGPYIFVASNDDELRAAFANRTGTCYANNWRVDSTATYSQLKKRDLRARVQNNLDVRATRSAAGVDFVDVPDVALDLLRSAHEAHIRTNCVGQGPGVQPLPQLLQQDQAAARALNETVVPEYMDAKSREPAFPYTYAEPYGPGAGITLVPAPNMNQWHGNPFANPNLDSDGDGFKDWEEAVARTDPHDPDDRPTVSPDPNRDSDGDGWSDRDEIAAGTDPNDPSDHPDGTVPDPVPLPDADGDGIPDAYDPCPFDALNRCADEGERDDLELPDDYAREDTLERVRGETARGADAAERTATASEAILAELRGEGELAGEPALPELAGAWEAVRVRFGESLDGIRLAAAGKVGFNAGSLIPQLSASSGGSCDEITITLLGLTRPLGWCDSVFYNLVTTWGRNGIALIMLVGFAFASARTMGAL